MKKKTGKQVAIMVLKLANKFSNYEAIQSLPTFTYEVKVPDEMMELISSNTHVVNTDETK